MRQPHKWLNTLKQFVTRLPTNCLSVFDHFVELELKGLMFAKRLIYLSLHVDPLCNNRTEITS